MSNADPERRSGKDVALHVIIVVREEGRLKLDYSLEFEVPEVPAVGSYISIRRQDKREPWGEDLDQMFA